MAECREPQDRFLAVLGARDETEVARRVQAFRENRAPNCPFEKVLTQAVSDAAEPDISPMAFMLHPGDEIRIELTRLDPSTRAVEKTWTFVVRPPEVSLAWTYPDEESWIVGETARDIAEMLTFARNQSLPAEKEFAFSASRSSRSAGDAGPRYTVSFSQASGQPIRQELTFSQHIWAPASYEPLAAAAVQALGLRAAPAQSESRILQALEQPLSAVLEQESQRVSGRLAQSMLDPGAHEEAALILGTLALREAAGGFSDIRQTLCRMAAHLAVAASLRRPTSSATADYANALLLTLVVRQRDALAQIDQMERAGAPLAGAAFLRALRIRNTHDWRILKSPAGASLLERLEHHRALAVSLGTSHALESFLSWKQAPRLGDWGRILFEARATVEAGNLMVPTMIPSEVEEIADTWHAYHGTALQAAAIASELNARPTRLLASGGRERPTPRVIGWGVWARFFQRNICFEALESTLHLKHMVGLPDDASGMRIGLTQSLASLELAPRLITDPNWDPARDGSEPPLAARRREHCPRAAELTREAPERLTPFVWNGLEGSCDVWTKGNLVKRSRWFNALTPSGTALEGMRRAERLRIPDLVEDKAFGTLHELAPFEASLALLVAPPGDDETHDEVASAYGPLADYDVRAMRRLARTLHKDVAAARKAYARIASLDPDTYLTLGAYLEDVGLEDEAAAAYENGIAKGRDRVSVANSILWLVGYYCDRNRTGRAGEIAKIAADVYSALGLQAMGYLMERTGRYSDAEAWYQRIVERYDYRGTLEDFYIRYERRIGDGRFRNQAAAALASRFPAGLQRVALGELVSPPLNSPELVRISGKFQKSTAFGLLKDDVVVALNGYRIHNDAQYQCVWTLDDKPEAAVIVWRNGRYIEIKGKMRRMRYGPLSQRS